MASQETPPLGEVPHGIGLGLAAVGRPGYINLGREQDLPADRSAAEMRRRTHELLDYAYTHGVRYLDAARSYGRAEEFLADWLDRGGDRRGLVIGSKWGYTYTANWQVRAETHEVKDHSVATYERQLAETRHLLGRHLDLYQVHSVTPDSPVFTDTVLQHRLADLAADGVTVGLSTSGPRQRDAIRAALDLTVDGEPLFHSVQATWNLLEPSAGPALAEAHDAGRMVIIKEALANGRLAHHGPHLDPVLGPLAAAHHTTYDALALATALRQPWTDVVLSGAATIPQLASNLTAARLSLPAATLTHLSSALADRPPTYWTTRTGLPWT